MKFVLWGTLCLTWLSISCTQRTSFYIITKEDSIKKENHRTKDGVILMPPKAKYAAFTFVIDSNNSAYFYSFPEEKPTISVTDDEEMERIGLMPNHVFSIPVGMEKSFFETNVLSQKSSRPMKNVMVASFKDTVRGDFLPYLKSIENDKTKKVSVSVRLALPEEREVLEYKRKVKYYEPRQ